jgi:acyl-CoA thioesterase-1
MTRALLTILLGGVLLLARPAGAADAAPIVLVLGDSLSAGYGIDVEAGWVRLLQTRLTDEGYPHRVVNASISGDTSGGGRRRLPELLANYQPQMVVIELGANDGLRGVPLREVADNFSAMLELVRAEGAKAVVVRMRMPPNYGPEYTAGFDGIYDSLPVRYPGTVVTPFLLAEVALDPDAFQADGLHPTAEAQPRLLAVVWPSIAAQLGDRHAELHK